MNNALHITAPTGASLQPAAQAPESPVDIFDRYADSVIGIYANHYDAVEVHGVRNFASGSDDTTAYEIDNVAPTSFSVYVRLKDGGMDCVGDFGKHADAAEYGSEVGAKYGWPVRNYVLDQHRTMNLAKLQ